MIIGIDGYAGAGKDTAADSLLTRGFVRVSFADALRNALSYSFNLPLSTFLDRDIKDTDFEVPLELTDECLTKFCEFTGFEDKIDEVIGKFSGLTVNSPRRLMQFVGTEIGRETLSPTIWLDKYKEAISTLPLVVTPDCRFSNERDLIKELNGQVFFIVKDDIIDENHKSGNDKWPLEKYDVLVYNHGSKYELGYCMNLWWSMKGSKI